MWHCNASWHLTFLLAGMLFPQLSAWLAPCLLRFSVFAIITTLGGLQWPSTPLFSLFYFVSFLWSIYPQNVSFMRIRTVLFVFCSIIRAETVHEYNIGAQIMFIE